MSFFDDASLVMIPSGYKTSKVYSVKPTDGSGDLAFTRSNDTATRVGPDGLIEKVRTNLATYSNDFSNASWAKITDGTYSLVTESIVDAFGNTSLVYKFTLLTGSFFVFRKTLASATTQTTNFSLYLKLTNTATDVSINIDDNTTVGPVSTTNWQRLSNTRATASFVDIEIYTTGQPFYIFASQIELGDIATDYIATTSAAVSVGPVANVPRLDYLNSSCPRLLLEPQRTNLALYSEQFDNAYWVKANTTVVANSSIAPDGTTAAELIYPNSSGSGRLVEKSFSISSSTTYTGTWYLKASGLNWVAVDHIDGNVGAWFNLSTGTIGTINAGTTASIENVGNGWYRCIISKTSAGTTGYHAFRLVDGDNVTSVTANGTNGVLVWGAQLEVGAYATSYIPTLGAAVTRGADAASKTGISSLIGQTEGTIFVDASLTHSAAFNEYLVQVRANDDNRIFIYREASTNKLGCFARIGASNIYSAVTAAASTGTIKAAFAYKSGSFAFYVNGVQVATSSATYSLAATLSQFDIDQNNGLENGYYTYAQSIVFPTRLSNSDLAALTA